MVAGALFDFLSWLTTRDESLTLPVPPDAIAVLQEWAKERGLSLDDAFVEDWNLTLLDLDAAPKRWRLKSSVKAFPRASYEISIDAVAGESDERSNGNVPGRVMLLLKYDDGGEGRRLEYILERRKGERRK